MSKNAGDERWRLDAACRGVAFEEESFDTFFPEYESARGPIASRTSPEAADKCAVCPVTAECLDYAIRNNIQDGTWGGLAPGKRVLLKRGYRASEEALFARLETEFDSVFKD